MYCRGSCCTYLVPNSSILPHLVSSVVMADHQFEGDGEEEEEEWGGREEGWRGGEEDGAAERSDGEEGEG